MTVDSVTSFHRTRTECPVYKCGKQASGRSRSRPRCLAISTGPREDAWHIRDAAAGAQIDGKNCRLMMSAAAAAPA